MSDYTYNAKPQEQNQQPLKEKAFRIGKLKSGKYRIVFPDRSYYVKSVSGADRRIRRLK